MSGLTESVPGFDAAVASRSSLVSYVPTYAAVGFVVILVAGGAPRDSLDLSLLRSRMDALDGVELAAALLVVVIVAVVLHPLQLPLVRLLEGYWPRGWRRVISIAVARQRRKRDALASEADPGRLVRAGGDTPESRRAVLQASLQLRRRFPPDDLLLPTALGNVLRAMENDAGASYGADTVAWWPRLYPMLGDQVRSIVDDRRNQLDAACRFAATGTVVAVLTAVLLARSGTWLALVLVPLALAFVSYRAAVTAASAYGEAVRTAFDLHRFDLVAQLHLGLPRTPTDEVAANRSLTRFWLQDVPLAAVFVHPDGDHDDA